MNYFENYRIVVKLTLALLMVSCSKNPASDGVVTMAGGEQAVEGQFPSALYFKECSATKIGARHILTAAHCVADYDSGDLRASMQPDSILNVYHGVELSSADAYSLTIDKVLLTPGLAKVLVEAKHLPLRDREIFIKKNKDKFADVAVIVVNTQGTGYAEFKQWTSAAVSFDAVDAKTALVATGYGCEHVISDDHGVILSGKDNLDQPDGRLKFADFQISGMDGNEFWFLESNRYSPQVGLCYGDSGSGLYLADSLDSSQQKLAGIGVATNGLMQRHYFTRFDRKSDENVGACINSALRWSMSTPKLEGFHLLCR